LISSAYSLATNNPAFYSAQVVVASTHNSLISLWNSAESAAGSIYAATLDAAIPGYGTAWSAGNLAGGTLESAGGLALVIVADIQDGLLSSSSSSTASSSASSATSSVVSSSSQSSVASSVTSSTASSSSSASSVVSSSNSSAVSSASSVTSSVASSASSQAAQTLNAVAIGATLTSSQTAILFGQMSSDFNAGATAGGIWQSIQVNPDGTFTGTSRDANGAQNFVSEFSGKFTNVTKVSDTEYRFDIVDITATPAHTETKVVNGTTVTTTYDTRVADGLRANPHASLYLTGATLDPSNIVQHETLQSDQWINRNTGEVNSPTLLGAAIIFDAQNTPGNFAGYGFASSTQINSNLTLAQVQAHNGQATRNASPASNNVKKVTLPDTGDGDMIAPYIGFAALGMAGIFGYKTRRVVALTKKK
jgi:LPXTG-motif cell wall-anchored protein